jgi:hypothetical protein
MTRKPTPSMIVALIALAVALSGVAYAATKLQPNSVKSRHIDNGQVKSPDVRDNALTAADVKDEALTGEDIENDALGGVDIDEGLLEANQFQGLPPDPRVHSPGPLVITDDENGTPTNTELMTAGDFEATSHCNAGAGDDIAASITIQGPGLYSVYSFEGTVGIDQEATGVASTLMNVSDENPNGGGTFHAINLLEGGGSIQGLMHATVLGNSCVFQMSAFTGLE